jgi:hypothetical protein
MADAIELNISLTGYSLSHECGEKTALHFVLKAPLMTRKDQRFVFQFLPDRVNKNAWAPGLGF